MKARSEAARLIEQQLENTYYTPHKTGAYHYGKCELWELLDFIYEGKPARDDEYINGPISRRLRNAKGSKWE